MNALPGRFYRLVLRDHPGVSCDETGIALAGVPLVWKSQSDESATFDMRSAEGIGEVLSLAYGDQPPEVVGMAWRGLKRAASQLEAGNHPAAALEALMIGLPQVSPSRLPKLLGLSTLGKGGDSWQDEPRVPAGQTGGGQWTSGGAGAGEVGSDRPIKEPAEAPGHHDVDDGVYHPATDRPTLLQVGGPEDAEEGFRHGIGGNEPPYDIATLQDLIPGINNQPGVIIPLAPIDSFLGIGAVAGEANLAATTGVYLKLSQEIRAIDPTWRPHELQSLSEMSWEARNEAIRGLRIQRAVAIYRVKGDIRPLQLETLAVLQREVDKAYEEAEQEYNEGKLKSYFSKSEAIGNRVDRLVREKLQLTFNVNGIPFGRGLNLTINNRDPVSAENSYTIPDARLGNVSFDWTMSPKSLSSAQVRGFFRADSAPDFVVIIRPSQVGGPNSTYIITRPAGPIRKGDP
jgi:hypothetical protein